MNLQGLKLSSYLFISLKEALQAYESVLAIGPLRPYTEEFLAFEKEAMQRATEVYGYVWGNNSEVERIK